MNHKKLLVTIIVLATLVLGVAGAAAQSGGLPAAPQAALDNSFTYQGYLTDDTGTPIHDSCDLRFLLLDAASGGNVIGASDDHNNVQVEHGYFTVRLNDGNEYGANAFNGEERYIQIEVWCGTATGVTLTPQRLSAVPYAVYALNIPDHNHYGETWTGSTLPYALYLDSSAAVGGVGLLVVAPGGATGRAVSANGGIYSTADTELFLSPVSMVAREGADGVTLGVQGNGSMKVSLAASAANQYVSVPVSAYGTLFGETMYVKSLEVCYKAAANTRIDNTYAAKHDGAGGASAVQYVGSTDDQTATAFTCYTMTAATPRVAFDDSSWVHFTFDNDNAATANLYIYTIKLILTEVQN